MERSWKDGGSRSSPPRQPELELVDRKVVVARLRAAHPEIWNQNPVCRTDAEADRLAALADLESRAAYWKSPLASEGQYTENGVLIEPRDRSAADADARFAKHGGVLRTCAPPEPAPEF